MNRTFAFNGYNGNILRKRGRKITNGDSSTNSLHTQYQCLPTHPPTHTRTHTHTHTGLTDLTQYYCSYGCRPNNLTEMREVSFRPDSDSPETIPIFQPTSQFTSKLLAENNSWNHYECKQRQIPSYCKWTMSRNFAICIHRLTQLQTRTTSVKRKGQVTLVHVIKGIEEVKVYLHSFLSSSLGNGQSSTSRPEERTPVPISWEAEWAADPCGRYGDKKNLLLMPELESPPPNLYPSRYTDYLIQMLPQD